MCVCVCVYACVCLCVNVCMHACVCVFVSVHFMYLFSWRKFILFFVSGLFWFTYSIHFFQYTINSRSAAYFLHCVATDSVPWSESSGSITSFAAAEAHTRALSASPEISRNFRDHTLLLT